MMARYASSAKKELKPSEWQDYKESSGKSFFGTRRALCETATCGVAKPAEFPRMAICTVLKFHILLTTSIFLTVIANYTSQSYRIFKSVESFCNYGFSLLIWSRFSL